MNSTSLPTWSAQGGAHTVKKKKQKKKKKKKKNYV